MAIDHVYDGWDDSPDGDPTPDSVLNAAKMREIADAINALIDTKLDDDDPILDDFQTWNKVVITGALTPGAVPGHHYIVLCNTGALPTLPTAVGNDSMYTFVNIKASGTIALATTSSQFVDGIAPGTLAAGASITLISDNTGWRSI